jgi:hypothetical protein
MRMGVRAWLDRWGDWLLAAVLLALSEFDLWVKTLPGDQPVTSGRAAASVLFVLVTLPLAWRRRAPVAVLFTVIAAAACTAFAIRPSQGPSPASSRSSWRSTPWPRTAPSGARWRAAGPAWRSWRS